MIGVGNVDNQIKFCQLASRLLRRTVAGKLIKSTWNEKQSSQWFSFSGIFWSVDYQQSTDHLGYLSQAILATILIFIRACLSPIFMMENVKCIDKFYKWHSPRKHYRFLSYHWSLFWSVLTWWCRGWGWGWSWNSRRLRRPWTVHVEPWDKHCILYALFWFCIKRLVKRNNSSNFEKWMRTLSLGALCLLLTCWRATVHSPYNVTTTNIRRWLWNGIQQIKKATTTATEMKRKSSEQFTEGNWALQMGVYRRQSSFIKSST